MLHSIFYTRRREPRLVLPTLLAFALAAALTYLVTALAMSHGGAPPDRIKALRDAGDAGGAERATAERFRQTHELDDLLDLLRLHYFAPSEVDVVKAFTKPHAVAPFEPSFSEEEIRALVEDPVLPPDLLLLARYRHEGWQGKVAADLHDAVREGAERQPPLRDFNHVLADEALSYAKIAGLSDSLSGKTGPDAKSAADSFREAAGYLEREGRAFSERRRDLLAAIDIWVTLEEWGHVSTLLSDPETSRFVPPHIHYEVAVKERDWKSAVVWGLRGWKGRFRFGSVVLSGVTALAWAFVCARLGKIGTRPLAKGLMYGAAFALGVGSVVPTMVLIAIEEATLRLVETGNPGRDLLFYVFGVGVREEAAKLLMALPLLYLMRRFKWGTKLDVVTVGAFVGLGFAAEENVGYLLHGDTTTTLARFLTANFLHMSMTGILAAALDDLLKNHEKFAFEFSEKVLLVVGLHGGYDFLLGHEQYGGAFLAMAALVFLTRNFLDVASAARGQGDRGIALVHSFLVAVGVVAGVTYVHAGRAVGFEHAPMVMAGGALGLAVVVFFFVRSLGEIH